MSYYARHSLVYFDNIVFFDNFYFYKHFNIVRSSRSDLEVTKLIPCSTQLNTKFILLINVKMLTSVVGILTFISMIKTSERLKAKTSSFVSILVFYEQLKYRVS